MGCRRGDAVSACRRIEGMDVPVVPPGALGTVTATTLLGRAKTVEFVVDDGWGRKQFQVNVEAGDVEPVPGDSGGISR